MKCKSVLVGAGIDANTEEVKNVISGEFVFKVMDQEGLPFDIILLELKEKNLAFNIHEFILAAIKSKNFTNKRLKLLFEMNDNSNYPDFLPKVFNLIDYCFEKEKMNES